MGTHPRHHGDCGQVTRPPAGPQGSQRGRVPRCPHQGGGMARSPLTMGEEKSILKIKSLFQRSGGDKVEGRGVNASSVVLQMRYLVLRV